MAITRIKNNQITDSTITNVKIASGTLTGDLMNPNLTFNSNLTLNGNLVVTGNVTAVQSTTTQITDPLLTLGLGNAGTSYDLGLILTRGSGGNRFLGWKESDGAFAFINTTEDGTTTGNIATTAYSNVKLGNIAVLGSSTLGAITVFNNTLSSASALTVRSDTGQITLSNATIISGATILSSTLSVVGAATVASLTSNAGISGTTGNFSSNLTASALTVNNSATIGSTLGVTGNATVGNLITTGNVNAAFFVGNGRALTGLSADSSGTAITVSGNAQPNITSVGILSSLTSSGNVTANALTINNSATFGTTLGVTGNINGSSITLSGSLRASGPGDFDGGLQATPIGNASASTGKFTTLESTGNTTVNQLTVNSTATVGSTLGVTGNINGSGLALSGSATVGSTLGVTGNINGSGITLSGSLRATGPGDFDGGLQSTPIGNVAPSTALFTSVGSSGNATVAALTVNGTATIGSTLGVTGTLTGAAAQFTTINGSGTATLNSLNTNNATTIGTTLTVGGTATVNALTSNTSLNGATLNISGNAVVGNLTVQGNLITVNSQTLIVIDPIIQLNTGPNGAPLTVDNNFDVGVRAHYYDTADRSAFFGRKDSSGYFEYFSNVTSESGNVITGTYGTIKTGNLELVSAATVGTTLVTGGNTTVNALSVNNSATVGGTLGVTGNLAAGNVATTNLNATNAIFTNNVTVAGTLTTTSNIVANTSGIFYGNAITGNAALFAGVPGFTTLGSNVVMQIAGNVNSYSQINFENINNGPLASTDFVLTADNGNDSTFFADFGIASSTHNDPSFFGDSGSLNDAYLYVVANGVTSGSTSRGNLVLGSTNGIVKTFVGNTAESSVVTTHTPTQFVVNAATASTNSATGALRVLGGAGIAGAINGGSTLNVAGTATVNSLVSNGAVSGTSAQFTTVNGSANATVNALTVNNTATIGSTLGVTGNINGSGLALSGSATVGSTLGVTGNINGSGITLSGSLRATGAGDFDGGLQATPIGNASASTGQFTTVSATGNVTAAALTANGSITAGTTLRAAGGVQNTPIGNGTPNTGAFTTLTANGAVTFTSATDSTSPTTGAVVITGGLGVGADLNVTTEANLGNVNVNNTTISSRTANVGLNINPNGTGTTTINSGLNASRTVINGTTANTLVVSGTQVGIGTNTFVSGATLQVNAKDSFLLPAGATGDRPGSTTAGMLRFNTSSGTIEWWNGSTWAIPTGDFTVVVANTQTGNGSATIFTLPVANATTAGTIVSINGVVQQPVTAYSVTGANVTFTEAPSSTDVIDFRVFTTTTQVTSVTDAFGNTGLFYDLPAAGSAITTFRTSGVESFSIQANSEARFTGDVVPGANVTYDLGSSTRRWKDLWLSGTTLYLGNIQIKETSANTISFLTSNGTTPAALTVDISDPSGIQGTPIGNASASTGTFTVLTATGASNLNGTVNTNTILPFGNANANIGSAALQFNTVFAKATSAQYADLAENYAADQIYEPGTVVHFGGAEEITKCDEDMCQRVAGVVSTNPAYIMNSGQTGIATAIALQGRVPTKVKGPVRKGDMMVSAGNGYARSEANPKIGSVIGKALENFDGAEGVIEVVVGRL